MESQWNTNILACLVGADREQAGAAWVEAYLSTKKNEGTSGINGSAYIYIAVADL